MYRRSKRRELALNARYGDIVKGLPVPDDSCRGVYCSHVLHHLALVELRMALTNTYRMLESGGVFRLVVPDLEYLVQRYLTDSATDAVHRFMLSSCFGYAMYSTGLRAAVKDYLTQAHRHRRKWMWDYKGLAEELRRAGFVDIRRAEIGDSEDPMFQVVESPRRWNERDPEKGWWERALGIECRK